MSSPLRPIAESVIMSLASILTLTTAGCEAFGRSKNQVVERTNTGGVVSPLHDAAGAGNVEEVRRLLDAGEHVDARDEQGRTPLHVAAGAGKVKLVQLLLDRGANPTATDQNGEVPMRAASTTVNIEMQELMTAAIAEMDAAPSDREKLHEKFHEQLTEFARPYNEIMKSLRVAAQRVGGQEALDAALLQKRCPRDVQRLVRLGANVHARDERGRTALHDPCCEEDVLFLLERGLDVNTKDDIGRTPLHNAASTGTVAAAEALIAHGAAVNVRDNQGNTPLHHWATGIYSFTKPQQPGYENAKAIRSREMAMLELLLQHGADINAKGLGRAVLHTAACSGDTKLLEYLVSHGAELNVLDQDQRTPLDRADGDAAGMKKELNRAGAGSIRPFSLARLKRLKANAQWLRDHGAVNGPPPSEP